MLNGPRVRLASVATLKTASLLACLVAAITSPVGGQIRPIDVEENSFSLSAQVAITNHMTRTSDKFSVQEFHSHWQKRSKIDYRTSGSRNGAPNDRGTFYAEGTQAFRVAYDPDRCESVKPEEIERMFHRDILRTQKPSTKPWISGTARLLIFINRHLEAFKLTEGDSGDTLLEATIDGVPMRVFYGSRPGLPLNVPWKISAGRENEFWITYRFTRVVPLAPYEFIYSSAPSLSHGHSCGELTFDMLAIDRGLGCSLASKTAEVDLPALVETSFYRFTFDARVAISSVREPVRVLVGYEPELETLRVDRLLETRMSRTLVNYNTDRIYHTIRRKGAVDALFDGILGVRENAGLDNDVSCVVARIGLAAQAAAGGAHPYTLGRMLLGTSRVTCLGLARVRGIEAHAYEASDSRLPVWLEQPSVYLEAPCASNASAGEWRARVDSLAGETSLFTLTTVFYLSQPISATGENGVPRGKLLLMEIYKKEADFTKESLSINIHDFSWDLQAVAPNGQRLEHFYSLGNDCLARPTANNHYARVDFVLGNSSRDAGEPADWLRLPVKRNLAVLRALSKQLGFPHATAYDIESSFRRPNASKSDAIAVTVRAADRSEAPMRLLFLGKGYALRPARAEFRSFPVLTFQVCYMAAGHHKTNTLFAFGPNPGTCQLHTGELPAGASREAAARNYFTFDSHGPLEVYEIAHETRDELSHGDHINALDKEQARLVRTDSVTLSDPTRPHANLERNITFRVAELEVLHANEKTPYELDEQRLADVNKFPGFGLVAGDARTKLVAPRWAADATPAGEFARHLVAMTFGQCQEACLLDAECRSFSTCVADGRTQCALSPVDFRRPELAIELMLLLGQKSAMGATFSVALDAGAAADGERGSVLVRRHPTCELHNKMYGDLFADAGALRVRVGDFSARPVSRADECAEICFRATLEAMRAEAGRLLGGPDARGRPRASALCADYFYLDLREATANDVEFAPEQILGPNTEGATRGYCLLGGRARAKGGQRGAKKVEARRFEFDFAVLYEKRLGWSLLESELSPRESAAQAKIVAGATRAADLEVMRAFAARGGNSGYVKRVASASACARMCFAQSTPLWPACRSFDLVQASYARAITPDFFCLLNTASLDRLLALNRPEMVRRDGRQERVHLPAEADALVWHYEPKRGLAAGALEEAYRVRVDETDSLLARLGATDARRLHLSSFGLVLVVGVALTAGLVAGVNLSARRAVEHLLASCRAGPADSGDNEILVESRGKLESKAMGDSVQSPEAAAGLGGGPS